MHSIPFSSFPPISFVYISLLFLISYYLHKFFHCNWENAILFIIYYFVYVYFALWTVDLNSMIIILNCIFENLI